MLSVYPTKHSVYFQYTIQHTTYSSSKPCPSSGSPVEGSQSLDTNFIVFKNDPVTMVTQNKQPIKKGRLPTIPKLGSVSSTSV